MNYFILTADPDFVDLALAEVRRAHAHVVEALTPGVLLAEAKQPFETLAEALAFVDVQFIHFIGPVYGTAAASRGSTSASAQEEVSARGKAE